VIVQCLRSDFSCFGHYNRSCLLTYLLTLDAETTPLIHSSSLMLTHQQQLTISHMRRVYSCRKTYSSRP